MEKLLECILCPGDLEDLRYDELGDERVKSLAESISSSRDPCSFLLRTLDVAVSTQTALAPRLFLFRWTIHHPFLQEDNSVLLEFLESLNRQQLLRYLRFIAFASYGSPIPQLGNWFQRLASIIRDRKNKHSFSRLEAAVFDAILCSGSLQVYVLTEAAEIFHHRPVYAEFMRLVAGQPELEESDLIAFLLDSDLRRHVVPRADKGDIFRICCNLLRFETQFDVETLNSLLDMSKGHKLIRAFGCLSFASRNSWRTRDCKALVNVSCSRFFNDFKDHPELLQCLLQYKSTFKLQDSVMRKVDRLFPGTCHSCLGLTKHCLFSSELALILRDERWSALDPEMSSILIERLQDALMFGQDELEFIPENVAELAQRIQSSAKPTDSTRFFQEALAHLQAKNFT